MSRIGKSLEKENRLPGAGGFKGVGLLAVKEFLSGVTAILCDEVMVTQLWMH